MRHNIKQMTRILEVLTLKRQTAETELAKLARKDHALLADLNALNAVTNAPPSLDEDVLSFAMAAPAWALWQDKRRKTLNKQRESLAQNITRAQNALRILIVQIDNVEISRRSALRFIAKDLQARQSDEAQEIWQVTKK